jgi:NADP-reducing hydrogenase subunit HndB
MPKLKPEDLDKITDRIRRTMLLREGVGRVRVLVHMGTCGIAAGARTVMKALLDEIESSGVEDVLVSTSSCAGLCSREPMMTVILADEPPVKYADLTAEKVKEIFQKHVVEGTIVSEYALAEGSERML